MQNIGFSDSSYVINQAPLYGALPFTGHPVKSLTHLVCDLFSMIWSSDDTTPERDSHCCDCICLVDAYLPNLHKRLWYNELLSPHTQIYILVLF